jgi:hypothetical protein
VKNRRQYAESESGTQGDFIKESACFQIVAATSRNQSFNYCISNTSYYIFKEIAELARVGELRLEQ